MEMTSNRKRPTMSEGEEKHLRDADSGDAGASGCPSAKTR